MSLAGQIAADRTIFLMLAPIAEKYRRSESELWPEFEVVRASMWAPWWMRWHVV